MTEAFVFFVRGLGELWRRPKKGRELYKCGDDVGAGGVQGIMRLVGRN